MQKLGAVLFILFMIPCINKLQAEEILVLRQYEYSDFFIERCVFIFLDI